MDIHEFARWAVENSAFESCDLDGAAVQEKALACGIIGNTKYDPKKHGSNNVDAEPGADWLVFTNEFIAAASKP